MRRLFRGGLIGAAAWAMSAALAAQSGTAAPTAGARSVPGARVLVDAHNAYPTEGQWHDRIDRALATGLPVAIEQDLFWYRDPATGVSRSVVAHTAAEAAASPGFEEYFFVKVKPFLERALADGPREDWPLIVLNLDFKSTEPDHLAAVWKLLGKYESWLTTAERTAGDAPAPLRTAPMMVLTGSSNAQQTVFHDNVPVGQRLRLFGAILSNVQVPGADARERAVNLLAIPPAALIPAPATNYRRWANFSWGAVEVGAPSYAEDWRPEEGLRLKALVSRAHAMNLWIRFYTLNGHTPENNRGWGASYNFGSPDAAAARWRAAIDAGVDFIASDQYESLARLVTESPSGRRAFRRAQG